MEWKDSLLHMESPRLIVKWEPRVGDRWVPLIWSVISLIIKLPKDPGRIWPGKRMPGRMGGKTTNTLNLKVSQLLIQVSSMYYVFTNINHLEEHKLNEMVAFKLLYAGKIAWRKYFANLAKLMLFVKIKIANSWIDINMGGVQ